MAYTNFLQRRAIQPRRHSSTQTTFMELAGPRRPRPARARYGFGNLDLRLFLAALRQGCDSEAGDRAANTKS